MSTTEILTNILNQIRDVHNFGELVYPLTTVTLTTSDSVQVYITYRDTDNKYTYITIAPSSTVSVVSIQGSTMFLEYDFSDGDGFLINYATSATGDGFYNSTDYEYTMGNEISCLTLKLVDTVTINLS